MRLWGYNHEEGGEDYLHWTKHISYSFIGREDIVLTDGQPSTGDDEDNGLFDTAKNIYGVFDDSRFRDTSYTMTVYNDPAIPYNNNYNGYYGRNGCHHPFVEYHGNRILLSESTQSSRFRRL